MFRISALALVLVWGFGSISGQNAPGLICPQFKIDDPGAKNTLVGKLHHISVSWRDVPGFNFNSLKFKWTLPEGFPFEGQDGPYISFVVTRAMEGKDVKVLVEIDGLPAECGRTATTTFRIEINGGSPVALDEYESLPLNKERARLKNVKEGLDEIPNAKALVLINYRKRDRGAQTRSRAARVASILVGELRLPKSSLAFVFSEAPMSSIRIYAWISDWPPEAYGATEYANFGTKNKLFPTAR
jgi:hypothetical protein